MHKNSLGNAVHSFRQVLCGTARLLPNLSSPTQEWGSWVHLSPDTGWAENQMIGSEHLNYSFFNCFANAEALFNLTGLTLKCAESSTPQNDLKAAKTVRTDNSVDSSQLVSLLIPLDAQLPHSFVDMIPYEASKWTVGWMMSLVRKCMIYCAALCKQTKYKYGSLIHNMQGRKKMWED